jgi:hypothetical protein
VASLQEALILSKQEKEQSKQNLINIQKVSEEVVKGYEAKARKWQTRCILVTLGAAAITGLVLIRR